MTNNVLFKRLYDDVEIPVSNGIMIDLKIHSFHKIDYYDGILPQTCNTFHMTSCNRVLVKMGYCIYLLGNLDKQLNIVSRPITTLKEGLTVLDAPKIWEGGINKELEVLLYNSSDTVILLKKGYRIAQLIVTPKYEITLNETII